MVLTAVLLCDISEMNQSISVRAWGGGGGYIQSNKNYD